MNRRTLSVAVFLALACRTLAAADPIPSDAIPAPLRPWVDWVLYGQEEKRCPFFSGDAERRQCSWPSRLALDLTDRGGRFTQEWFLFRDAWVLLPGDARVSPQDVRVDGRPAVVAPQPGGPGVRLPAGRHAVSGGFEWDALPPLLQVPVETGIVGLSVRGRTVPFPQRDEHGRLWLQKQAGEEQAEDRLEITVHRKVTDDVPLILTTRVDLQISGKSREVVLGRALPAQFVPMSLGGALPARIDPDGGLRVQARAGRFTLEITARHEGPVTSVELPAPNGPWAPEETWVFEARPHLRLAVVEGVPAVDPQQTTLPEDWKNLPAYLMQTAKTMTLVEKRRGDSDPAPDQLSLQRSLWLDFQGGGITVHDAITGAMARGWRLEMLPPATLGRAAINGQDQFITRLGPDRPAGVEIRQGQVSLDADSRVEGTVSDIPAVGWDHDFTEVSADLNLPPAWRLFHARGVDDVSATWISTWSLLDLFLVLIASLSIAKLRDVRWGAITLLTLVLCWIEPDAPQWSWLAVLLFEALGRALPAGRFQSLVSIARGLALVVLAIVAVPFMVQQVRAAIYPALERPWGVIGGGIGVQTGYLETNAPAAPPPSRSRADMARREAKAKPIVEGGIVGGVVGGVLGGRAEEETMQKLSSLGYVGSKERLYAPDPKAVVQTGPGLPDWTWRQVELRWRGPVKASQRLQLFLVPPFVNRAAGFLRAGLVAVMLLGLYGVGKMTWPRTILRRIGLGRAFAIAAFLLGVTVATPRSALASEIPPQEMLNELRDRLLSPPECRPNCASSPRLALEATPETLRLRIEIDAAAGTAVPLPGGADQWLPDRVVLDGGAAGLLRSPDGRLWLRLTQGNHQVLMEGPLPDRDAVQIPLPLKPHRVTARASGWRVEGLHEDGLAEDNLQLVQVRTRERAAGSTLEPGALPPFVRVERNLMLGLKWEMETRVVRLTPPGSAIVLEVPLLAGESVTTADVRVKDGKASVSLGPLMSQAGWSSTLEQRGTISLKAPDAVPWVEVWRLQAGPVWHVEPMGIPVVHQPEQAEVRMREWHPWPGETVAIEVTRPQGLPGQTLTIDRSALSLSPGLRAADASLDLTMRSSRGAQHVVTLPVAAELQSVSINGVVQPIRQEGRDVTLPMVPGAQQVSIVWRRNDGIGALFRAPEVRLNAPSVNLRVDIRMPMDRWTLIVGGPRLGPAVLFWSLLAISLIASIALGRARLTPLRAHHWFLLSLGLTQAPLWVPIVIAAWLFGLGWRRERGQSLVSDPGFDGFQVLLLLAGAVALSGLFWSISQGLLGLPEMQIAGNGSASYDLKWYQDRSADALPRPWVLSVPLLVYRLAMLAWSLWLAQALLRWLKWAWECFTAGGAWRPLRRKRSSPPPIATPGGAPS